MRWYGRKWVCFGVACERFVVGWETKKFKCLDEVLGRKERWTRMTLGPHYPPLTLFRLRCIHLNQGLWRGRTPLCVSLHCDDTCSECCATYVRAVRTKPVPIKRQRHPCRHPTSCPKRAHAEARVRCRQG